MLEDQLLLSAIRDDTSRERLAMVSRETSTKVYWTVCEKHPNCHPIH